MSRHILRGGCCDSSPDYCRSATRHLHNYSAEYSADYFGFRIVYEIPWAALEIGMELHLHNTGRLEDKRTKTEGSKMEHQILELEFRSTEEKEGKHKE
jgi:hypothetical protein